MQNRGQGAIEYLLIIAAAILVVAIVILAITGALSSGQDQSTTSQESYIQAMDNFQKQYLIAADKLVIGGPATLTGTLRGPLTRADGTLIITQTQLDEALANGELVIYLTGTEQSIFQKPASGKIITTNGCYQVMGAGMLVYPDAQSDHYAYYKAKILSVNNDPTFSSIVGNTYSVAPWVSYAHSTTNYFIIKSFSLLNRNCNNTFSGGLWRPGSQGNGWQVRMTKYTVVLGDTAQAGEIAINPTTGQINGLSPLTVQVPRDCDDSGKWCYINPLYQSSCTPSSGCTGACVNNDIPDVTCAPENCEKKSYTDYVFCTSIKDTVPTISADYFRQP